MIKKHLNNIIALIITIIFTVIVVKNIDFTQTLEAFKLFNIKALVFLIPFFLLIMTLRAKRWEILLPKTKCRFYSLYEIYMTSNLLNIFLPARAGDVFRGLYFGKKYEISRLNALGTVAAERILDGLTVVSILLIAMLLYSKSPFVIHLVAVASVLFVCSFLIVLWIYKYNKIDQICETIKKHSGFLPEKTYRFLCSTVDRLNPMLNSFIKGFETFANLKTFVKAVLFSILSWMGDCIFIYLLIIAFGVNVGFSASLFVVSFIALSTIIPSSSMYIGLYQFAFMKALDLYGIGNSEAFSISLSQQGIMLIAYIIVALIFVLNNHINFSELKKNDEINNGKHS